MAQHDLGVLSNEEAGELLRHHFRIDPQSVEEDNRWLDENASDEDRWRAEMLLESTIFEEWKMFCDDPTVDPADFEPRDE
ncbi:MAG: hypothetical protein UHD09_07175 [Bifidobacterium sp.]|nr:hypothetical protein [Bifidobacterium sp.]